MQYYIHGFTIEANSEQEAQIVGDELVKAGDITKAHFDINTIKNVIGSDDEFIKEKYIVTYCHDIVNNNWKSNQFTNKTKALEYYTKMKKRYNIIYFK